MSGSIYQKIHVTRAVGVGPAYTIDAYETDDRSDDPDRYTADDVYVRGVLVTTGADLTLERSHGLLVTEDNDEVDVTFA